MIKKNDFKWIKTLKFNTILLICLFNFLTNVVNAQNFKTFVQNLPTFKYPLTHDFLGTLTEVSLNECWVFWMRPITKKMNGIDSIQFDTFLFDTIDYIRYGSLKTRKIDWNSKQPNYFYSPIMTGDLYCSGKTKINENLVSIIWAFLQKDYLYGKGMHYWLANYDTLGNFIDVLKIYQNIISHRGSDIYRMKKNFNFENDVVIIQYKFF